MSSTPIPVTPSDRRSLERAQRIVAALRSAEATNVELDHFLSSGVCAAMVYACATSDQQVADSLSDSRYRKLMLAVAEEVLMGNPPPRDRLQVGKLKTLINRMVESIHGSKDLDQNFDEEGKDHWRLPEDASSMIDLRGPLTAHVHHLIEAIEAGERRAEAANLDLLATYERTRRLGAPLHSVVTILDAPKRREGGPLNGIAIAVKDCIDIAGVARGHGNPYDMAGEPSALDAPVIASLREAGADVYATTTMLEYAAVAMHPGLPEAKNPFDHSRTAGGSSGGSAALVGVGGCQVALGTDTGGSIRIPAHYCGIVGFKPSYNALSRKGVQPLAPTLDHVGLFGNDVSIVERVFSAITGRAAVPKVTQRLRVGVDNDQLLDSAITSEVRDVLTEAIARIAPEVDVLRVNGEALDAIRATWEDIILFEAWQTHGKRVHKEPDHYGPETLRFLEESSKVSRNAYLDSLSRRSELLPRTEAIYKGLDILITPAAPYVAPVTMPAFDSPDGGIEARFSGIYNVTGAPALVLPCGFNGEGLPIGIQLSARIGADVELLRAALRIESLLEFESRAIATDADGIS